MKKIYDVMPENKLQTSDSSVGRTWPFVARDSLQSNSFSNLALTITTNIRLWAVRIEQ
jgi:hypothetical protein